MKKAKKGSRSAYDSGCEGKVCDENCWDCFYYCGINGENGHYCSYLLRTNRSRPCNPGKGCTVKVKMRVKRNLKGLLADEWEEK